MRKNLPLALSYILMDEGGFAARAEEPGGAVNKGVSLLVFKEWRARLGLAEPTVDDLRELTDEEAGEIFAARYAEPIGFDRLPAGMDYALLNTAVMEGVRGARLLYLDKGVSSPLELILHHMNKKLHAPSRDKFGPGWGDRLVRVAERTKRMMDESGQTKPANPGNGEA